MELVILGPGRFDVVNQFLATVPGVAFQVIVAKGIIE